MRKLMAVTMALAALWGSAATSEVKTLWKGGDNGVKVYRIPALCTAPNGDLVAVCDARPLHGGDLYTGQPINITCRRSSDGGRTWTAPEFTYVWPWNETERRAASDPSLVVDAEAKKIFLFCNTWATNGLHGVYQFYVQESADNGKTWSAPRDITEEIAFPAWPFGKPIEKNAFIFISSGSGIQTKDGTLLHTLVRVGDGNALFGSTDHGRTWKAIGSPAKRGDECKVVELEDGRWMINSRWHGGGRQIHVSKDRGKTWESRFDSSLLDPVCNAQLLRVGKLLLFSNCKSKIRSNLCLRVSADDGLTWSKGIVICPGGSAYSDLALTKDGQVAVLYEGAGSRTVDFVTVPMADVEAELAR